MLNIGDIIGNTPIVKIIFKYNDKVKYIYAKLEMFNLTGSIKDRVAYYMINNAKEKGLLKEGMPIIEATSGNTGISLSALGKYFNHPVHIFMPDWASSERVSLMESFGAHVYLVSKEDGGFKKCLKEANNLAKKINGLYLNQFSNKDNYLAHYETTGKEILDKLDVVDGFVSGIGTGGTFVGVGTKLKEYNQDIVNAIIEPANMPLISKGKIYSNHKIEGIGDDFVPELLNRKLIDKVFLINDDDAINMARKLALDLGLGVGISSGANFLGTVLLGEEVNGNVVTIFVDDNKKYLSTDLFKENINNEEFLSNKIELLTYEVI